MSYSITYCIVGTRPDGTIGIRLYSNSASRAKSLGWFVKREHPDWTVKIEPCPESLSSGAAHSLTEK